VGVLLFTRYTLPRFMQTNFGIDTYHRAVEAMLSGTLPSDPRGIQATNPNNVQVTRLPYKGERKYLKFDNRSFSRLCSKKKGRFFRELTDENIDYRDFKFGMHVQLRCVASEMRLMYTPAFAANDEQARLVLAQQCYSYAAACLPGTPNGRVPEDLVNDREKLDALMKRAVDAQRRADNTSREHNTHLDWIDRNGGYLELRAKIQHRAWRLFQDCVTIAEDLGLTSVGVRQILQRLVITGRRLGLETFPPHHSYRLHIPADLAIGERPENWIGDWGPGFKLPTRSGKSGKSKRRQQAAEELALLPGRPWIRIISRS
jgi:hypothetical protein